MRKDELRTGVLARRSGWGVVCVLTLLSGQIFGQTVVAPSPTRGRSVAYLGAFLGDVTEDRLAELKLTEIRGAVIGRVVDDSPAARAGLKVGDVLLSFRGESVEGREHFNRLLTASVPGRLVTLGINRDGVKQNVHVALSERRGAAIDEQTRLFGEPDEIRRAGERMAFEAEELRQKGDEKGAAELAGHAADLLKQAEEGRAEVEKQLTKGKERGGSFSGQSSYSLNLNRHLLGVFGRPLNSQLAGFFAVTGGAGLLVTEVRPGGLVERAGIKAGDCIIALNGERIASLQELTRQMGWASRQGSATEVVFSIVRDRIESTLKASLGPR